MVTTDTDSAASTPLQPHAPRHAAGKLELPAPGPSFGLSHGHWLALARFLISVTVSAVLCTALGRFAAPSLTPPIDIVGNPTFTNYNFKPLFWYYRLTVYAFPLFAVVGYALLARFGPLRTQASRPAKRTVELVEPVPTALPTEDGASWGTPARILLPAAVVVIACGTRAGHPDLIAVAAGVVYAVAVVAIADVWARRTDGQRWRALAAVNGVGGAVAAVLSLWFVSAHTVVQATTGTRWWPWLPWWLAVLGVVAIVWWALRQLRGGRAGRDVELTLLTVVVGSIAVFLAISALPGQLVYFEGFDGSWDMACTNVIDHGYFPWRDIFLFHGLFPDVLEVKLGQAIFGDNAWGVIAGRMVILNPLLWVCTYLFAVWVSRRNPWFLALVFLCVIGPGTKMYGEQFMGVPIALIALGETLRRRTVPWVVGLTLLLFVESIMVPETAFVAAPALACVVGADLVHRRPGQSLWTNLRLTRWCLATGLVATAAFVAFLAAFGALRGFIDGHLVILHGWELAAAIPPRGMAGLGWTMFAVSVGCVLLTVWAVAIKLARRAAWEARDWVAVAAAAFMALYVLEKALKRLDVNHFWLAFDAGLPLVLWWGWRLLDRLGQLLAAWWRRRGTRQVRFVRLAAAVLIPVIALALVYNGPLRKVDGRYRGVGFTESSFARVGYAAPPPYGIDTGLLRDLGTAIRAYAGDNGPVFDMTYAPGYVYYLLDRVPPTRFIGLSMAESLNAQRMLIDELKTTRPPVVLYDATSMGLPGWDQIANNVRHYEVSDYVLRNWTPVLRTHGVLVMARNDLADSRPVPALSTPPQTTDLYFSGRGLFNGPGPSCRWGATPNFLPIPDSARAITLAVRSSTRRTVVHYTGWAVDPATKLPASSVLIADGDRVVAKVTPTINLPEVAQYLHQPKAAVSGFQQDAMFDAAPDYEAAYSVGADGLAHRLLGSPAGSVATLRQPNGTQIRVAPTSGGWEHHSADVYTVGELRLPSGIDLRDYDLATLSSGLGKLSSTGGFGGATVALTDQPLHEISASWLDQGGPSLTLRVGSCPQWYGYDPSQLLYVMQSGGPPVTSVTLSEMQS